MFKFLFISKVTKKFFENPTELKLIKLLSWIQPLKFFITGVVCALIFSKYTDYLVEINKVDSATLIKVGFYLFIFLLFFLLKISIKNFNSKN